MKRAVLYLRVSTADQNLGTQRLDLEQLAQQRGLSIIATYSDQISGAKVKRPGLEALLADARRGKFDVLLIWAFDRLARSTRHLLETLDELNHLGVQFVSFREAIDTGGALGRAFVTIIGAIAEFERSLIVERVRAGLRRAKLEGRRLGRPPMNIDRAAVLADRRCGLSLTKIAHAHRISRASVSRIIREERTRTKSLAKAPLQITESTESESAA